MTPRWLRSGGREAPAPPMPAYDMLSVAMVIGREFRAPPPLDEIGDDVMLAVAPGYGQEPEEWQDVRPWCWIAWPHAAGAIYAEEMTAAQLRDTLAARDGHG